MVSQKDNLGESNAKKEESKTIGSFSTLSRLDCLRINLDARKWFRRGNI